MLWARAGNLTDSDGLCRKLWDIGVYVAVTSVDPLRVYTFDNVLMRHCTGNYSDDLAAAPRESYVVAEDYSPPWAIPSLRPYYVRGMSTANVLRAYLADQGEPLTSLHHYQTRCCIEH